MDEMWLCGIDSYKDVINIHMDEDSITISVIDEQRGNKFGGIEAMENYKNDWDISLQKGFTYTSKINSIISIFII